jgi:hypothetical protein
MVLPRSSIPILRVRFLDSTECVARQSAAEMVREVDDLIE